MTNSSQASEGVANLATKLQRFGELRAAFKEAEAYAKNLEAPYRAMMAEVVDDMTEAGITSVNVIGHGTFNLRGTTYSRIIDMPAFLEFALNAGLVPLSVHQGFVKGFDGDWAIAFKEDRKEVIVEGSKVNSATLVNGQLIVDVPKGILNDLVVECEGNVPGVVQFTTRYITVYEKKK